MFRRHTALSLCSRTHYVRSNRLLLLLIKSYDSYLYFVLRLIKFCVQLRWICIMYLQRLHTFPFAVAFLFTVFVANSKLFFSVT